MQEARVPPLGLEDPPERGMATHASILAWEIPRTEEPGGLQSMGSQKNQMLLSTQTHMHTPGVSYITLGGKRKWSIAWASNIPGNLGRCLCVWLSLYVCVYFQLHIVLEYVIQGSLWWKWKRCLLFLLKTKLFVQPYTFSPQTGIILDKAHKNQALFHCPNLFCFSSPHKLIHKHYRH